MADTNDEQLSPEEEAEIFKNGGKLYQEAREKAKQTLKEQAEKDEQFTKDMIEEIKSDKS